MAVNDILKSIGWPEDILILDFETYFDTDYTLSKLSIIEYVLDKRFDFTGLGIQLNNHAPMFFSKNLIRCMIDRLKSNFGHNLEHCTVIALNCKFDVTVLFEKFSIDPPYVIDILDLARYYDSRMSHKLKDLAKMFKLLPKGETMQFKGLHYEDMTPEQCDALNVYCKRDIEDEKSLLDILLPILDNPAYELTLARHTLNLFLKPTLRLDHRMATEIVVGMDEALRSDLEKVSWVMSYAETGKKTIPKILRAKKILPKILEDVLPEGEHVPMKQGKNEMIPALAQEDVPFQLLLAHSDEKVRNLCKAKAACSSWPLHQKKVKAMIKDAELSGGLVRIPLNYYGAHTGRWSGGGDNSGKNPLNMGGKGRGKPIHPLIAKVRGTLVAPSGYTLIIQDSAQVEARELAWFSGQQDLVDDFASGGDPYSRLATKIFGEEVRKPKESDDESTSRILSIRRGFGKDAILGCGYGMGTNTFFDRCRQNENLRPLFDSGEYDWDFINGLIKTYRTTYSRVPKFWDEIEKMFRIVTKYPNEVRTWYIPGTDQSVFTFWKEGSTTIIQLPSGRRLFYRHASVSVKSGSCKYEHGALWGGTLTENVDQAICRDLMAEWLLECEANDIPIVLHTYDELVGCVPIDQAEEKLQKMHDIMCVTPDWAAGLPLAAEGEITERYKK